FYHRMDREKRIELLRECDVVITNPPFSLLREFVKTVMKYGKKFLIVGNQNTVVCNDLISFIKNDEMWFGYGFKGGAAHFINMHYDDYASSGNHQSGMIRVSGVVWFTNMDTEKRHVPMNLTAVYIPENYPKYDDVDAINVDFVNDIPKDYYGLMGVPVTFMTRYCPDQFSILGLVNGSRSTHIGGRGIYKRLLIKRK
ncbi:modification methylase, partial [Candidatus Nomurabacteria bacterium]|nr:modification methylase [Candidatus Nomurabacteria bacterium]